MVKAVLCADIMHTQGASDYAFVSFLSFALMARKELAMTLSVRIPVGVGRLDLRMLYTQRSLEALAANGGFTFEESIPCDYETFDVRISDTIRLREGFNAVAGPVPEYNLSTRPHPRAYLSGIWPYLRTVVAQAHAQPVLRISLALLLATHGVLAHTAAAFHAEALQVVSTLRFSAGPVAPTPGKLAGWQMLPGRTRPCGYVFVPLVGAMGVLTLQDPSACSEGREVCALLAEREKGFRRAAEEIIKLHAQKNIGCAVINVMVDGPQSELYLRSIFANASNGSFQVHLPLKPQKHGNFSNMKRQWESYVKRVNNQLPHEDLIDNIKQRYAASRAPLFVVRTDAAPYGFATHWADVILAKRTADGLPSAVITTGGPKRSGIQSRWCGGPLRSCGQCTFFRTLCVEGDDSTSWLTYMATETVMCKPRWRCKGRLAVTQAAWDTACKPPTQPRERKCANLLF